MLARNYPSVLDLTPILKGTIMAEETRKTPIRFTQTDDRKPVVVIDVKPSTLDAAAKFILECLKKAGTKDFNGVEVVGRLKVYTEE